MKRKAVIITGYAKGESYGLLGPQMAATIIEEFSSFSCIVIAVTRCDDRNLLRKALSGYFGKCPPVIGFSMLGGRDDLLSLAKSFRAEGAITLLAGPQAGIDFTGETGCKQYPHRFQGYSNIFSFALQGPAQQILPFLDNPNGDAWKKGPGIFTRDPTGNPIGNLPVKWDEGYLNRVDWQNIYRIADNGIVPLTISTGQVVQQIGCPHAVKTRELEIPYPASLDEAGEKKLSIPAKGCSFCDVAVDKSYCGALGTETVLEQIACLPDAPDGRKIPFELINENPLPGLPGLLTRIDETAVHVSSIHLTMRADWFVKGETHLHAALDMAVSMGVGIVLTSMGFESFDDGILNHLNKGLTAETNLKAVKLIRKLKRNYPQHWGYRQNEGGNHGFIHPTPWDTPASEAAMQRLMARHRLPLDILPPHSTPLVIHHASALADWIRAIEEKEKVRFERKGSVISWWQMGERFLLDS